MLIEVAESPPTDYHYLLHRGRNTQESCDSAAEFLKRQGCTKVIHAPTTSYGIIEPIAVVQQRAREPQYG